MWCLRGQKRRVKLSYKNGKHFSQFQCTCLSNKWKVTVKNTSTIPYLGIQRFTLNIVILT